MRVSIDAETCTGHGRCYTVAPELFDCDDRGYGQVRGDGTIDSSCHAAAQQAVDSCPERAISIARTVLR